MPHRHPTGQQTHLDSMCRWFAFTSSGASSFRSTCSASVDFRASTNSRYFC